LSGVDPAVREKVAAFWAPPDLRDRVAAILEAAGRDATNTPVEDLAGFDQYHVQGLDATLRLARQAGVSASDHVLDVGSGMGGPARMLAKDFGCRVTGIDLTPAFVETAVLFNQVARMSGQVSFQHGDATQLPFGSETFDVVWTQHIAQSVPEKDEFFSEMVRVLRPGGTLVLHDLYRASAEVQCSYPSSWDRDGSITFLATLADLRRLFEVNALQIDSWTDSTPQTRAWLEELGDQMADPAPPPAGIPGLDFSLFFDAAESEQMMVNALKDIDSGALGFVEVIAHRPPT
jgi:MPBQ/MSBQ methyltransferase